MHIVQVQFPVTNYEGNGVFFQSLFFQKSPTKEEYTAKVQELNNQDKEYETYLETWQEILDMIDTITDWKKVTPFGLIGANTFVDHPKFGKQPVSFDVREVY